MIEQYRGLGPFLRFTQGDRCSIEGTFALRPVEEDHVGVARVGGFERLAFDHAGLKELFAEVLADNVFMLKLFEKSGLESSARHEGGIVHVRLRLCERSDHSSA